eukprot:5594562-Heterocapsa_arctica.AAC.1
MERQHTHQHYISQESDQRPRGMACFCLRWYQESQTTSLGQKCEHRPNYKGVKRGVDEATTRKFYQKLAQTSPMKAGALHTILADG